MASLSPQRLKKPTEQCSDATLPLIQDLIRAMHLIKMLFEGHLQERKSSTRPTSDWTVPNKAEETPAHMIVMSASHSFN